jgi:hypothetical protein
MRPADTASAGNTAFRRIRWTGQFRGLAPGPSLQPAGQKTLMWPTCRVNPRGCTALAITIGYEREILLHACAALMGQLRRQGFKGL